MNILGPSNPLHLLAPWQTALPDETAADDLVPERLPRMPLSPSWVLSKTAAVKRSPSPS